MSRARQLDINALVRAADQHDGEWFSRQSEDARKEFAPVVALRWAASVSDSGAASYMLWLLNEQVNVHLFDLHHHPILVYRLLAACGLGRPLRHHWLPLGKRKSNKAFDLLAAQHPDASEREIDMLLSLHTRETFAQFIEECGIQDSKDILKHYDER